MYTGALQGRGRRLQGAGHLDATFMSLDQTTHGGDKMIFWGRQAPEYPFLAALGQTARLWAEYTDPQRLNTVPTNCPQPHHPVVD